jgi:CxxC-x17-CxxC domain-containing protein
MFLFSYGFELFITLPYQVDKFHICVYLLLKRFSFFIYFKCFNPFIHQFIEKFIYLNNYVDVVENKETYNLLLKTPFLFLINKFYTILFLSYYLSAISGGETKMGFNDRGNSYRGGNRDSNRGGFRGGNSGPREMTKVTCSDCGVETEVPFKPTEGRPVYCRDCLPNHRRF